MSTLLFISLQKKILIVCSFLRFSISLFQLSDRNLSTSLCQTISDTRYLHQKVSVFVLCVTGLLDGEKAADTTQGSRVSGQIADDPRRCLFCGVYGDQKPSVRSLLTIHQSQWAVFQLGLFQRAQRPALIYMCLLSCTFY